jgi:hypothetical protein
MLRVAREPARSAPLPPARPPARPPDLRSRLIAAGNAATARWATAVLQRVTIDNVEVTTARGLEDNGFAPYDEDVVTDTRLAVAESLAAKLHVEMTAERWKAEVVMRATLIDAIRQLEDVGYKYNWDDESIRLPEPWEPLSSKEPQAFAPRAGESKLAAIRRLFEKLPEDEEFFLDCSSAIAAAQYRALAEALEAVGWGFDKTMKDKPVVVSVEGLETVKLGTQAIPPPAEELYDEVTLAHVDDLLPGDLVYFRNFRDYDATHEGAEAAWEGEHCVYAGNGRYRGFGVAERTLKQMVDGMIEAYNKQGRKKGAGTKKNVEEDPESLTGVRPGPDKQVRRMRNPVHAQ